MSVTSSSRSSGSSGPSPRNSFLISSTRRARSASVSRRPSSSRVSPMAAVTLAEISAGSSISMRETSIDSNSRLSTLILSSRVESVASSRARHTPPPRNAPGCSVGAWLLASEILSVSLIALSSSGVRAQRTQQAGDKARARARFGPGRGLFAGAQAVCEFRACAHERGVGRHLRRHPRHRYRFFHRPFIARNARVYRALETCDDLRLGDRMARLIAIEHQPRLDPVDPEPAKKIQETPGPMPRGNRLFEYVEHFLRALPRCHRILVDVAAAVDHYVVEPFSRQLEHVADRGVGNLLAL